jgi:2OG-Fe(II) oxygenase superfamily
MADGAQRMDKAVSPEHYIFDGVVSADELLWIYHELLSTASWKLTHASARNAGGILPFMSFPGLEIETRGHIQHEFLSGYFRGVIFRIRDLAKRTNGVILPANIRRIHVGAKSSFSKSEFHVDAKEEKVWTILGFLNPIWNAADGGEFFLDDHKIEYLAGRFVVFPSNIRHDGGYVKNEKLNYWRVAVNVILDDGNATS